MTVLESDGDLRFDPKKGVMEYCFPVSCHTFGQRHHAATLPAVPRRLEGRRGEFGPNIASLQYKAVRNENPRSCYWQTGVDDPTVPQSPNGDRSVGGPKIYPGQTKPGRLNRRTSILLYSCSCFTYLYDPPEKNNSTSSQQISKGNICTPSKGDVTVNFIQRNQLSL